MKKPKIAISLDKPLLDLVDSKVDGSIIRSRSQAIEFYLRKGLQEQSIDTAVLLIKGEHQIYSLKNVKGKSLIKNQLDFFYNNGIKNVFVVTQHSKKINLLLHEISDSKINAEIIEKETKGNANVLNALKDKLSHDFIVMSGDTYNNFDLRNMIKKHLDGNKIATIGLMSREKPSKYGIVVLEGDLVIDFKEKPKIAESNVVNAGIYVFKPEVFHLYDINTSSLEKDLLPKIARIKQLVGYFTHGEYLHVSEG
jgi:mannose-1-phosphate guanylyltransferase